MFCPNCGNNCGDARFCPSCGTQLQQATRTTYSDWRVGMPCPNCGGTQLDGQKCAFCGSQLVVNVNPAEDTVPIPYGHYKEGLSSLDLREDHLVISRTFPFSKRGTVRSCVSYSELKKVILRKKGPGRFSCGYLSVRWADNIHIPTPNNDCEAATDYASVTYCDFREEVYEKIYLALKAIIENNERA